ncbi:MAG: Rrf2 family transcriptional regulator [Bdellovibrionaceae bacterium]|nr:Rrf2 family transcriptional regulator [Pseudobdellovibrionaceae bacterium]|tara:strand:+ start:312 stop:725 length:414 start_codon:yes stop_codon:yes gene_type:complete
MRLTDHTDYSLRVLIHLNQIKKITTLAELSKTLKISRNNLIKVSNQLSKLDYIISIRGRNGGIELNPKTKTTTLKEIISHTEENFHLAECFSAGGTSCTFVRGCKLKKSLSKALENFLNSLANTTLNDVTPSSKSRS